MVAQLDSHHNGNSDLQDGSCLPVQDYGYPGVALQQGRRKILRYGTPQRAPDSLRFARTMGDQ